MSGGTRIGFFDAAALHPRWRQALHAAVRRHAGDAAFIQRCQVHIAGRDPRLAEGWNSPPGKVCFLERLARKQAK